MPTHRTARRPARKSTRRPTSPSRRGYRGNPSAKDTERAEAVEFLRKQLRAGDVVYTSLEHAAASGMQRVIGLHIYRGARGETHYNISGYAAKVLGQRLHAKHFGVVMNGAGMDMGFDLVYRLSNALFGDGYKLTHTWL